MTNIQLNDNNFQNIQDKALQIHSLFSTLKTNALYYESGDETGRFSGDVDKLSEIGFTLIDSIYKDISEIETETVNLSLAVMISQVLKHPDIPEEVADGLLDGLTEYYNSTIKEDETSIDYIAGILSRERNGS